MYISVCIRGLQYVNVLKDSKSCEGLCNASKEKTFERQRETNGLNNINFKPFHARGFLMFSEGTERD